MSLLPVPTPVHASRPDALNNFVVHAQLMLDPATPESVRRDAEPRLLALLPTLQVRRSSSCWRSAIRRCARWCGMNYRPAGCMPPKLLPRQN